MSRKCLVSEGTEHTYLESQGIPPGQIAIKAAGPICKVERAATAAAPVRDQVRRHKALPEGFALVASALCCEASG